MEAQFVNPFLTSLINVLQTMAQLDIQPEKPHLKKSEIAKGDVSGLIGMVGPQTKGSFSVTFDEDMVLEIMQRMLGERSESIDEEVTDMVGEITNMVTGGAKRILSEKGFEFEMATPVVVSGKGHTINHKSDGPVIIMPFKSPHGTAFIEICFDH
ncbi:chemotaxis protein CheX [Salinivibrio costicola]|uniref:Chemotaxis protein CheX n=1 Tax=Salinivibrio costicola subsp. alcaliphilus TaxID=272773 RepID=A0ABX3KSC5_SALCS|nr:chemotaxis protein CheX [Salinivibrio costicola]OOF34552.1 chemotaxis protein CheX [Salinivibrio costicola subsp. alcaliphilus]